MTSPTDPEVPLHTRLLDTASTLALYAEARAVAPSIVQEARKLIESIPALLTEAASTLIGKQAVLRGLMDTYTAAGGEGVATLEAIHNAIKLGADPNTKAALAAEDSLIACRARLGLLEKAYMESSGGRLAKMEDLVAAIHRGAR